MNFSHFFIRRPIFAGVLSIVIFIIGLIAMSRLPISEYPEVVPPTIVVRATYPGANPKTIAETVASRWSRPSTASKTRSTCFPRPPATVS